MQDSKFGYALANGTVGVYDKTARFWRIKVILCSSYELKTNHVKKFSELRLPQKINNMPMFHITYKNNVSE